MQRSNFTGAVLVNVDFTKAELGRADFTDADITGTKFSLANLARADFTKAKFTGPIDFANSFFFLTRIEGIDLSAASGLAQWQVDMSCGDDKTKLPGGLTRRKPGPASSTRHSAGLQLVSAELSRLTQAMRLEPVTTRWQRMFNTNRYRRHDAPPAKEIIAP